MRQQTPLELGTYFWAFRQFLWQPHMLIESQTQQLGQAGLPPSPVPGGWAQALVLCACTGTCPLYCISLRNHSFRAHRLMLREPPAPGNHTTNKGKLFKQLKLRMYWTLRFSHLYFLNSVKFTGKCCCFHRFFSPLFVIWLAFLPSLTLAGHSTFWKAGRRRRLS